MKAVIMAGGEGTRLRPLSLGRPKPMTPLLGRPVMEHSILLLKKHGIRDICVTLCYRPQSVMDYFGDGSRWGVRLTYFVEEEPLGTAGSVRACRDHLGREDVLVIGGDCVCDLDLGKLAALHREREGAVTLALYAHPSPLEYGLVVTDPAGRVERFVEKPGWGQVVTNQVNTGIYLLSPQALDRIPAGGAWDFGKDLFPALLEEGVPLYGCLLEGYWRDMGDCGAYLDCLMDALSGKVALDPGLPRRGPGIWSAQPLPAGVLLTPPCWLGPEVELGRGVRLGPGAVLERGARVDREARVERSVLLEGAAAGPAARLEGAILCPGAVAREATELEPGTVLGENALAEAGAVLTQGVRLWPGQSAPAGCCLKRSVTCGSQKGILRFVDGGVIRGVLGEDLGPEALLALGSVLGREGRLGLGCSPDPGAGMLARAAAAGAAAAGGTVWFHGLECPVQGAWAARREELPVSLFVEREAGGPVYLHFFDRQGLTPGRAWERKVEHALLQGEYPRVRGDRVGPVETLGVSQGQWARAVAREAALVRAIPRRLTVAVGRDSAADRAVREALLALGCRVEENWRPGIPAFAAGRGGFLLSARDERGALLDPGQLLVLSVLIEMENGGGTAAVPPGASAAVELVAAGYGGRVLRLDRDGPEARDRYAALPWLWSAPSAAARICARMGAAGQSLESLMGKTPRFSAWRREVPLSADRGRVMQALAGELPCREPGEGLRFRTGDGWVWMVPLVRRSALRVVAEGPDLELAAELCDFYANKVQETDREIITDKRYEI